MKLIKLTLGKYAIVDDKDYDSLNQWHWYCNAQGYAVRKPYIKGSGRKNQKSLSIRMHVLVNQTPEGFETDHVNRNRLDNRRENLRTVTSSENKFNTKIRMDNVSGVKGVFWENYTKKWKATIQANYKSISLGRYSSIDDAILARQKAEGIYHAIS